MLDLTRASKEKNRDTKVRSEFRRSLRTYTSFLLIVKPKSQQSYLANHVKHI